MPRKDPAKEDVLTSKLGQGKLSLDPDAVRVLEQLSEPFGRAWAAFASLLLRSEPMADSEIEQLEAEVDSDCEGTEGQVPIGHFVRERLDALQISQTELARRMGVSAPVVSRVLMNPNRAKLSTLDRIARAIGFKNVTEFLSASSNGKVRASGGESSQ